MPNEKETGRRCRWPTATLDLVRREARGVALGDHARAHALAALRPRGVRGRTRVQDRDRHRHLPAEGAHRSPVQLRAHLHDEDPVQPRRADGGAAAGGGENGHEACYVRPIAFYGSEKMGVSPIGAKVHVAIAAQAWRVPRSGGAREGHPGQDLLRAPPRQRRRRAKSVGTYPNSVLATLEATQHGYDEGCSSTSTASSRKKAPAKTSSSWKKTRSTNPS